VAPIPHPTLRGAFLSPPLYAPAPPALGLVPAVTGKNTASVYYGVSDVTLYYFI